MLEAVVLEDEGVMVEGRVASSSGATLCSASLLARGVSLIVVVVAVVLL